MKRMLLTISYDGTAYHGWQVQENAVTVQQTLQDGLERLLGARPSVTGCSRTDSGVHARQFCCHFDCDEDLPETAFTKGLDSLLPNDISVKECHEVFPDFHARYNTKSKTYIYYIYNSKTSDPFLARYSWRIEKELDMKLLNEFCKGICGKHDFLPFSSSGRTVQDTVRTVIDCRAEKKENLIAFSITADGFLYNMVRIIVGTAVDVALGRKAPNCVKEILEKKERSLAGITAPPNGLFLDKVTY